MAVTPSRGDMVVRYRRGGRRRAGASRVSRSSLVGRVWARLRECEEGGYQKYEDKEGLVSKSW
jgi:hypothetical protein